MPQRLRLRLGELSIVVLVLANYLCLPKFRLKKPSSGPAISQLALLLPPPPLPAVEVRARLLGRGDLLLEDTALPPPPSPPPATAAAAATAARSSSRSFLTTFLISDLFKHASTWALTSAARTVRWHIGHCTLAAAVGDVAAAAASAKEEEDPLLPTASAACRSGDATVDVRAAAGPAAGIGGDLDVVVVAAAADGSSSAKPSFGWRHWTLRVIVLNQ